jgi:Acyl-protein synthetase, LuxE
MSLTTLLELPQYGVPAAQKDPLLCAGLAELTEHHRAHCADYARMLEACAAPTAGDNGIAAVPWVPVGVFKQLTLASVAPDDVFKTLTSSGTTGQSVSRIPLDRTTAALQSKALSVIMQRTLGSQRLPMLIVDSEAILKNRQQISARAAGLLGMMSFGRDHLFALDEEMQLRTADVQAFVRRHRGSPLLVFGFTFMVWQHLYQVVRAEQIDLDLSQATLIHSGGWKKLIDQAVAPEMFSALLREAMGIRRVRNFYGMVEQVGSVFVEGDSGYLHTPNFADIIVRDPVTWDVAKTGEVGVIEVLSLLPRSYPGHAILTEDLGIVHGRDQSPCGRHGTYFSVVGRVPQAELRGCSDVYAKTAAVGGDDA